MQTYFKDNSSEELILLFCGWGMDEKPFSPLNSSADVLFFYDYADLEEIKSLNKSGIALPKKYKKISLVAFSYGVFVAALLSDLLPKMDLTVAVNGTLSPVDNKFGIPEKIFKLTLENMTELTALKFREKLFSSKEHLSLFNKNLPNRDMISSKTELADLKRYFSDNKGIDFKYDKVFISEHDRIMPSNNQKNFWTQGENVHTIDAGHFLFYAFEDFDEILNYDR